MTPLELYALSVKAETLDLNYLKGCYFNHIPEIGDDVFSTISGEANQSVRVKIHHETNSDGRRFWRLASVWFNDQPFMIIQNAGREGDDHRKRWITDRTVYSEAVQYIHNLGKKDLSIMEMEVVAPTDDLGDLYTFYGHDVRRWYDWSF